jgi:hypothetical protein
MSIVGDVIGGIMGAGAAGDAASVQQKAAQEAQKLEQQNQQKAQDFQSGVWSGTQQNEQPFLGAGQTSVNNLASLANNPNTFKYGQTFQAPTLADVEATPGYQFQLQQGTDAINKHAAATGNLLSGNTGKALEDYGQGLASTTYNDRYNQALQTYMTNYGVWNQGLQNQLGTLSGLSGVGLSSAGQLGALGQSAAGNMANIDLTGGAQQAQQINNAAAARASGILGQNQAWQGMIGGLGGAGGSIYEGLQGGGGFGDVLSSLAGGGFI